MDVALTARQLEELVASAVASHNVLLVPLGPNYMYWRQSYVPFDIQALLVCTR